MAIARALAADPDVLVADEPTSMLDVSIRMDVLNLLLSLKKERRLAILLITHDLASARYLADRVLVLFRGRVVEEGPSDTLVRDPKHPYTRALLAAIADAAPFEPKTLVATQEPAPEPAGTGNETPDTGCPFALRCPEVHDLCRVTDPAPRRVGDRRVRCHLYPGTPEAGS